MYPLHPTPQISGILALHSLRMLLLCLKGLAVAIVTLSDVRTPTLVIDVDAIASDRSLEQLVPDVC
jgi:hypothetical protein